MGLRARTLWAGGILLALLLGSAYAGLSLFLGRHIDQLELEQTGRDGLLARKGLDREVQELGSKISDWSDWDDADRFMRTLDNGFVKANLDTAILANMRLREIAFLDLKGRVVADLAQQGGRRAASCRELIRWLSDPKALSSIASNRGIQGWFVCGETPILVVARPIHPTSRAGSPSGMLVFVRSFGKEEMLRMEEVFPFTMELVPARAEFQGNGDGWRTESFPGFQRAETGMIGLDGRKLLLRVTCPLRFQDQRRLLGLWLGISFLAAAVVFALSGLVLLERLVLQRLFHLEQDVAGITAGSTLRIHATGNDEIARLARNIDHMVESLRRATSELRRTRDLAERAEKAKTRLLASVSHEMRTPLNGILGLADLLRRSPRLSVEDLESADMVSEAGSQLLLTVNTLLDHSRLETGDLELECEEFPLEETVALALADVMPMAHRKNLPVHCEFDPGLPGRVLGDAQRLRQLLRNLLDNAVKFTGTGEIRLKVVRHPEGGQVFEITDTGIGIDATRLQAIFRPFEQAGSDTFFAFGGVGLGLSISRLLAERMNGRIDVRSVPGKGSAFAARIHLPPGENAEAVVPVRRWMGLAGRRIGVADPSATTRSVLAGLLRSVGMEVVEYAAPGDLRAAADPPPLFWGFSEEAPARSVRISGRDGHEKDAGQASLFVPLLPSEVLRHCCELLRTPLRVGLRIPNAVLRSLVAGILRKVGHEAVVLEPGQTVAACQVFVVDVREGDTDLPERIAELRAAVPGARIVLLVGATQVVPGFEDCPRVRRPVDGASLLWEVDGWGGPVGEVRLASDVTAMEE
jgi:signal transduction histidine kinase